MTIGSSKPSHQKFWQGPLLDQTESSEWPASSTLPSPPPIRSPAVGCCGWRKNKSEQKNAVEKSLSFEKGVDQGSDVKEKAETRHDVFHFYGIPLQSPTDRYTFLRKPSTEIRERLDNYHQRPSLLPRSSLPPPKPPKQPHILVLATSKGPFNSLDWQTHNKYKKLNILLVYAMQVFRWKEKRHFIK